MKIKMKIPLLILIYIENLFFKPRKATADITQKPINSIIKLRVVLV